MELIKQLETLGLTKNESKVYIALSKIGETTASEIIKRTSISSSKVYESLERLLKKGMISYTVIKNKKYWKSEKASKIKEFLNDERKKIDEKEKIADSILDEIDAITKKENNIDSQYKVFEGFQGIKTAREQVLEILDRYDTFYVILSNYENSEKLDKYWVDFQNRRVKKKIKCKYILNETLRKPFSKDRTNLKYTQTKYVKSDSLTPMWIEIYKNRVGIGILNDNPSTFLIENEEIAKGFVNYFDLLWKSGKD